MSCLRVGLALVAGSWMREFSNWLVMIGTSGDEDCFVDCK